LLLTNLRKPPMGIHAFWAALASHAGPHITHLVSAAWTLASIPRESPTAIFDCTAMADCLPRQWKMMCNMRLSERQLGLHPCHPWRSSNMTPIRMPRHSQVVSLYLSNKVNMLAQSMICHDSLIYRFCLWQVETHDALSWLWNAVPVNTVHHKL
jgi:hypothetical protein